VETAVRATVAVEERRTRTWRAAGLCAAEKHAAFRSALSSRFHDGGAGL